MNFLPDEPEEMEFEDNIWMDETYVNTTLTPYLKDLYGELSNKFSDQTKGILKFVFLDVRLL